MEWLIGAVFVTAFLYSWRFVGGWVIDYFGCGDPDPEDIFLAVFFGLMLTLLGGFAVIPVARGLYVLWTKYGPEDFGFWKAVFPAPRQVESRRERNRRIEAEREMKAREDARRIKQQAAEIARLEKELKINANA